MINTTIAYVSVCNDFDDSSIEKQGFEDASHSDASDFSQNYYYSKRNKPKRVRLSGDDLALELDLRKSIKAYWKIRSLLGDDSFQDVVYPVYPVASFSFPESLNDKEQENLNEPVDSSECCYVKNLPKNHVPVPGFESVADHRKKILPKEINAQNNAVRLKRSKSGLGHVNELDDVDLRKRKAAKFEHRARARPRNGLDFQVGIQDVVVKSGIKNGVRYKESVSVRGKRGKIKEFSKASINRMKLLLRNIDPSLINSILTLTYPSDYPNNGRETKRHLDLMKRWLKRHGVKRGFWFGEFQGRGAHHFHLFLSSFPRGGVEAVSKAWYQIVNSGDPKHLAWHNGLLSGRKCLELMRNPLAASVYATKYASKMEQKEIPEGFENAGRFWGQWGDFRPVWTWIRAGGEYALSAARQAILEFRSSWSNSESLERFDKKPYLSCTMWGGSRVLDDLLLKHEFVPF